MFSEGIFYGEQYGEFYAQYAGDYVDARDVDFYGFFADLMKRATENGAIDFYVYADLYASKSVSVRNLLSFSIEADAEGDFSVQYKNANGETETFETSDGFRIVFESEEWELFDVDINCKLAHDFDDDIYYMDED